MTYSTSPTLFRTPLFDLHKQSQARIVEFSGWEMPVQYQGIVAEHQAVRQGVGMFDISHMGKFDLKGENPLIALQPLVPTDLSQLRPGQAKYTVFLNHQGGIVDDLIVYCHSRYLVSLIVNAATTAKDWAWLQAHLNTRELALENQTDTLVLVALQGPKAAQALQPLVDIPLDNLKNYHHQPATIHLPPDSPFPQVPGWIARTGYTGEDGFEIMVPRNVSQDLWQAFAKSGVTPCGLGARDTLRLEAAMALYGQDIDQTTTPLEAGLGWLINWEKGDFIGRSALEQQKETGVLRKLVGFLMEERQIPRPHYLIAVDGQTVGSVTSGSLPPTIAQPLGLGYVPAGLANLGQKIGIEIRGKVHSAKIVPRPFYRRPKA